MKLFSRRTTCSFLILLTCIILFFGIISYNSQLTFATAETSMESSADIAVEQENLEGFYNSIESIQSELLKNGSSVLEQLQNQLNYYNEKLATESYYSKENVQSLITTTEDLIAKYSEYEMRYTARAPYHAIYTPIIAAAISYFNSKGYYLAAELLTHAKDNDKLDSSYSIEHMNIITSSTKFHDLVFGTSTSGNDAFQKTGNNYDDDCYYAIKRFHYKKDMPNSRTVLIWDRYDYGENDSYSGIEGTAVEQMYKAQKAGALIPFKISESIREITAIVFNQTEKNTYTETFDLSSSESRAFYIMLNNINNCRIQIRNATNSMSLSIKYHATGESYSYVSDDNKVIDRSFNFDTSGTPSYLQALGIAVLNVNKFKDNTMTITISYQ